MRKNSINVVAVSLEGSLVTGDLDIKAQRPVLGRCAEKAAYIACQGQRSL